MSKNPVVHFEMPYEDAKRVSEFYNKAFGWGMNLIPGEAMGNYITAETAETDANHMVKTPGTINGGFFVKKADMPGQDQTSVVVSVADIEQAMKDVADAGGKVYGEPVEIPGIGLYVAFSDTEGNRASLLQAKLRT